MSNLITSAKLYIEQGSAAFLKTFQAVPDDKLTWTPSATAKSAIRIAAHAGVSGYGIASMIKAGRSEFKTAQELTEFLNKEESKITTRQAAVQTIEAGARELVKVISGLTQTQIDSIVVTPFSEMPMKDFIYIPGNHYYTHAAQIDYLQTIWGDLGFHM